MDLKKSIFSYIIWAAFAPLCCLGLFFGLERAGISEILEGVPSAGIVGGVCVYLLSAAAVFMALRTICMEVERHIRHVEKLEAVLSVLLPILILTGAAIYLAVYLVYLPPMTLKEDSFYNLALVSDGKSVSYSVHGASWLYTCLLHVMMLVFGNTPFAGVVLQILLFFLCLLFLYIGMQAFAGVFPAAVSMAALGFLPVSWEYVFSLTPELFYLVVYLLVFGLSGLLYRKYRAKGISRPVQYVPFFLAGICVGFSCWLDISGVSLLFFFVVLISVEERPVKQALLANLAVLIGVMGGFFASVLSLHLAGQMDLSGYPAEFFGLYFREAGVRADAVRNGMLLPDVTLAGSMVLITLAFFSIPAFFLWKRSQNSAFIACLFFVYALAFSSVSRLDAQMTVTLGWSMLAGLGLYGAVRPPKEDVFGKDMSEEEDTDEEDGIEEKDSNGAEDISMDKIREDAAEKTMPVKQSEKRQGQKKPAPGEPLHNPLPVPEKKKRSAQDFGYQVEEENMKFDLDIKEDDDFDW